MKVSFTDKSRVCRSPYYLCNQLWDKLDSEIQLSKTVYEFKDNLNMIVLSEM